MVDEFCKKIEAVVRKHKFPADPDKKTRNRSFTMSDSEIITIMIFFHQSHCLGNCTGIFFMDSTPIRGCHIKREHSYKVFKGIVTKGKSTVGRFFGFKLHLVINDKAEIIEFFITQANIDDRCPLKDRQFHEKLFGKLFADKGYLSQSLFEELFVDNIQLITKIKKNMKNSMMHFHDKIMLRKRAIIETVNDQLKNICQIEHTHHRSFHNFIGNLVAGLIAYNLSPKSLHIIDLEKIKAIA